MSSSSGKTVVIGALILVPFIVLVIITSAAIKCSDIGRSRWEKLKCWRQPRTEGSKHRKHGSDLPIVAREHIKSCESPTGRRSVRSSWDEDIENEPAQDVSASPLG